MLTIYHHLKLQSYKQLELYKPLNGLQVAMQDEVAIGFDVTQQQDCSQVALEVYDIIKDIIDPERSETLEQLNVVYEDGVTVSSIGEDEYKIRLEFTPTVPQCSLATLIGLCLRTKLQRCLIYKHKLDVFIKEGTHSTAVEINKQINDKERTAAAMENPDLREMVEACIRQEE